MWKLCLSPDCIVTKLLNWFTSLVKVILLYFLFRDIFKTKNPIAPICTIEIPKNVANENHHIVIPWTWESILKRLLEQMVSFAEHWGFTYVLLNQYFPHWSHLNHFCKHSLALWKYMSSKTAYQKVCDKVADLKHPLFSNYIRCRVSGTEFSL